MTQFDDIIVGAGQAGPALAVRLAGAGRRVALIERSLLGGTCVNSGCTPTKTLIASAKVAAVTARAVDYGVQIPGVPVFDLRLAIARKDAITAASRDHLGQWLSSATGCTVIHGHASFVGPNELSVGNIKYSAERFFLNVGGRASIPDLPGLSMVDYLTSSSILRLSAVPRHLIVIGGSYVGLEFAQMFRRFGAEVTIVEQGHRLIGHEDTDVSECIEAILKAEGIQIRTDAKCIRVGETPTGVSVSLDCSAGAPDVEGSHLLVATGRRANTDDLGLQLAGVALDPRGNIIVDETLRSTAKHIFALGDCNGRGAFTHTAYNDYEIVAENLLENSNRSLADRKVAYALYIDPPLARVGFTEAQIRASGRNAVVGSRPMARVGRAVEKGETQGFMKIAADSETGEILGAAILGVGGDEAIHAVLDMMYAGGSVETLRRAVHIHPTVSELLPTIAGEMKQLI